MDKWQRFEYLPVRPLGSDGGTVTGSSEHIALSRKAAVEGSVLLKNNENILPLSKGSKIAVFGKGSYDYVKGGGGSGDVTVAYTKSVAEGLMEKAKEGKIEVYEPLLDFYKDYVSSHYKMGAVPGLFEEAELPASLLHDARAFSDLAVVVISRFSGENWDRSSKDSPVFSTEEYTKQLLDIQHELFEDGDFYLSRKERDLIASVSGNFDNIIVVLNVGGMVDVSWIEDNSNIKAAINALQGGIEGGSAVADLIVGDENPSGRLVDTYARDLDDYPSTFNFHENLSYVDYSDDIYVGYRYFSTVPDKQERVIYPFGYGLSYSTFEIKEKAFIKEGTNITVSFDVTNNGPFSGKTVVELYARPSQNGDLDKPSRVLCGFGKTPLLENGETKEITISFSFSDFASFDERISSFVLDKGVYCFEFTDDGVSFKPLSGLVENKEIVILERCHKYLVPNALKNRMNSNGELEALLVNEEKGPESLIGMQDFPSLECIIPVQSPRERMSMQKLDKMLQSFSLHQVSDGRMDLDSFIAALPIDVLIDITGGQPNTGVANTFGFGNQAEYGIPNVMTADGPAGLRINSECGVCTTAWPCATALASTWNTELVEEVGAAGGREVKENNLGLWLTPAVNIHRSPLCGRNFEYYSEDPLVAGKMGCAMVKGIQSNGIGACVKHFAFNNKETNRKDSDSRVSERAAREIYLKQFEMIVKDAHPVAIMSSYNIVNGVRASENWELLTGILRDEWGFEGFVTTDWWTHGEHYLELLAGNDLKMASGYPERVKEAYEKGYITLDDIRRNVKAILSGILRLD